MSLSAGARFRKLIQQQQILQVVGTINAYSAILAEKAGMKAIYLSGAGVANASYGLPDLGVTNLTDVLQDVRRITQASSLPLLVDADTGWGSAFGIARTVREMTQAGAAGIHIEDQVTNKRCGHRPGKAIVGISEMVDRIKAAVDARTDSDFVIMARTDAIAREGVDAALERLLLYIEAGADMVFPEAVTELDQYQHLTERLKVPVLANITEFGKTPLFTAEQLSDAGVKIALYPLSAFRAMSKAALEVYENIKTQGTQQSSISDMQTREELYQLLNYYQYEQKLDELYK